jgi:hypothetical protein
MGLADRLTAVQAAAKKEKPLKRRRRRPARKPAPDYELLFLHRPRLAEAFHHCMKIDPRML